MARSSLLAQLVKARLQLLGAVAVTVGIGLLVLGRWSDRLYGPGWLQALPVTELGRTLFGLGFLAVFFEYVTRKHWAEIMVRRAREAFRAETPAMRDTVITSWAADADELASYSAATLDRLGVNVLAARLGDRELAHDVYGDLLGQVVGAAERWRDVSVTVDLTPSDSEAAMLTAVIRWEYRVAPAGGVLRFACVSDTGDHEAWLRDPSIVSVWRFGQSGSLDASSRDVYELIGLAVDGKPRPIRRAQRTDSQIYTATLAPEDMSGRVVTVAYTYRVLVAKRGHLLWLGVPRPAKGLRASFRYSNAGIRHVTVLDLIPSGQTPRVELPPPTLPGGSAEVGFDGWVFPRSGVAFAWTLDDEPTATNPRQADRRR